MSTPAPHTTASPSHSTALPPATTEPPKYDDLRKRDAELCGYVSGNSADPVRCAAGYTCSNISDYRFGCCNQVECRNDWHTCQAVGGNVCDGLPSAECSSIYTSILDCTGINTVCFQYELSASLGAYGTLMSYGCGRDTTPVGVLEYATNGKDAPTPISSSLGSLGGTGGGGGGGIGGGSGGTTSSGSSSHHSGLSTGVIIGIIVVAALIVLAVIFGCCYCFCWPSIQRRRNKAHQQVRPHGPGPVPYQYSTVYNPSNVNPTVANPTVYNPSFANPSVYQPSVANPSVYGRPAPNPAVASWVELQSRYAGTPPPPRSEFSAARSNYSGTTVRY